MYNTYLMANDFNVGIYIRLSQEDKDKKYESDSESVINQKELLRGYVKNNNFNLVKEYNGEAKLYHMDVYRLQDACESIGFDDYFDGEAISIIEWSEIICDCLPKERLDINFSIIDENTRILKIYPHGEKYEELCQAVL